MTCKNIKPINGATSLIILGLISWPIITKKNFRRPFPYAWCERTVSIIAVYLAFTNNNYVHYRKGHNNCSKPERLFSRVYYENG